MMSMMLLVFSLFDIIMLPMAMLQLNRRYNCPQKQKDEEKAAEEKTIRLHYVIK